MYVHVNCYIHESKPAEVFLGHKSNVFWECDTLAFLTEGMETGRPASQFDVSQTAISLSSCCNPSKASFQLKCAPHVDSNYLLFN